MLKENSLIPNKTRAEIFRENDLKNKLSDLKPACAGVQSELRTKTKAIDEANRFLISKNKGTKIGKE